MVNVVHHCAECQTTDYTDVIKPTPVTTENKINASVQD